MLGSRVDSQLRTVGVVAKTGTVGEKRKEQRKIGRKLIVSRLVRLRLLRGAGGDGQRTWWGEGRGERRGTRVI